MSSWGELARVFGLEVDSDSPGVAAQVAGGSDQPRVPTVIGSEVVGRYRRGERLLELSDEVPMTGDRPDRGEVDGQEVRRGPVGVDLDVFADGSNRELAEDALDDHLGEYSVAVAEPLSGVLVLDPCWFAEFDGK